MTKEQQRELARIIGESSNLIDGSFRLDRNNLIVKLDWHEGVDNTARSARFEVTPAGDIANVYEV